MLPRSVAQDIARRSEELFYDFDEALEKGLRLLCILPQNALLIMYRDITEWTVGGAETYISVFEIEYEMDGLFHKETIIAKAVVVLGGITERGHEWIERSQRLHLYNVMTPKTYTFWAGTFFQQYIEHGFVTYFECCSDAVKQKLATQLLALANGIDNAGFTPISFISDLRTNGTNLYIVDVGSDLGHFHMPPKKKKCAYSQAYQWLKSRVDILDE